MKITHHLTESGTGDLTPVRLAELIPRLHNARVPPDAALEFTTTSSQADGEHWALAAHWEDDDAEQAPALPPLEHAEVRTTHP